MPFKLQKAYPTNYMEADPTDFLIRTEQDMLELITTCVENDTHHVILY